MKEIPLAPIERGAVALVDDADFAWLNQWRWRVLKPPRGGLYAARTTTGRRTLLMHRVILDAPRGMETDHRNGNGLDNRRQNLRLATKSENQHNQKPQTRPKSSRFKGVHLTQGGKWAATIKTGGKVVYLGTFFSETEAAGAYDNAAKQRFGEFALTNL